MRKLPAATPTSHRDQPHRTRATAAKSTVVIAIVAETARPKAAASRSEDRKIKTMAMVVASSTQLRPGR